MQRLEFEVTEEEKAAKGTRRDNEKLREVRSKLSDKIERRELDDELKEVWD